MSPDRSLRDLAGHLRDATRSVPRESALNAWRRYYWVLAGGIVAAGVLSMSRPFVRRHGVGPPLPHSIDSVIFEYVGWYLTRGNTLYTDVWEIKPPLAHLPPYLFAAVTGTDMYALHLLGIASSALALVVAATCASRVVGAVTDSPEAGLATVVALFAHPDLFYEVWLGYDPKTAVFAFGLAGVDRAVRDRHFASGVLAGLAVGFWQLGIVFPILTSIYAALTRSFDAVRRHLLGGLVAVAVVVGLLLAYADVGGFLAEVVLSPVVLQTNRGGFSFQRYVRFFPGTLIWWLTIAGVGGLVIALFDSGPRSARPLAVGGVLVIGVLLADFDGFRDTIYPLVFTALGVGILVGTLPRRAGVAVIVVLALLVAPTFAPSELLRSDPVELEQSDGLPPSSIAEREHVYWTNQSIRSCRFFAGPTQWSILDYYPDGTSFAEIECGKLDLYWNVTRRRLAG